MNETTVLLLWLAHASRAGYKNPCMKVSIPHSGSHLLSRFSLFSNSSAGSLLLLLCRTTGSVTGSLLHTFDIQIALFFFN
ncbi:hypothetical protein OPQ81_002120 [Rhizoctonia solani]|nr:hypothetical protein OPQ81_002120 [Rhizoctonia solani]